MLGKQNTDQITHMLKVKAKAFPLHAMKALGGEEM
jgi:hypothetical protein